MQHIAVVQKVLGCDISYEVRDGNVIGKAFCPYGPRPHTVHALSTECTEGRQHSVQSAGKDQCTQCTVHNNAHNILVHSVHSAFRSQARLCTEISSALGILLLLQNLDKYKHNLVSRSTKKGWICSRSSLLHLHCTFDGISPRRGACMDKHA